MTAASADVLKAVKGALVAGVAALGQVAYDNEPVSVTWGHPGGDLEREHIWFSGMRPSEEGWATLGDLQRDTEFHITTWIAVHKPGATAQEVEERALDLLADIEAFLRDDPFLGLTPAGTKALRCDLAGWELSPFFEPDARAAVIEARVRVKARI